MKVDRRILLVVTMVLAIALILPGCATAPAGQSTPANQATTAGQATTANKTASAGQSTTAGQTTKASQAAPAGKDTLIVAVPELPQSVDREVISALGAQVAMFNIYEPLVYHKRVQNADGKWTYSLTDYEMRLAESITASDDGKTWTIRLKKGSLSNYGNELTADVMKWNYERTFGIAAIGSFYTGVAKVSGMNSFKVVDQYTFQVTTETPNPLFFRLNGVYNAPWSPIDSVEAKKHVTSDDPWAQKWLAKNSASWGPYEIHEWTAGVEATLTAVKSYYRGEAKIKKVLLKEVPESSTRMTMLQEGSIDIALELRPREVKSLEGKSGITIDSWQSNQFICLELNNTKAPLDNKKVRQAIQYAIPQKQIIDGLYYGKYAKEMHSPVTELYPYSTTQFWHYDYNLDKAKELLKEAGFQNGFTLTIDYPTGYPDQEQLAVSIKAELEKIGIKVQLNKLAEAAARERLYGKNFEASIFKDFALLPDFSYAAYLYYLDKSVVNYAGYNNADVNKQVRDVSMSTMDEKEREKAITEAQKILMDDIPVGYIVAPNFVVPHRDYVSGATWNTGNLLGYWDIELTK